MKRLILAALALALLLVGGFFGFERYLASQFSPTKLAAEIERENNCRAFIGSTSVDLLARPAKLVLEEVLIVPREEGTPDGKPSLGRTGVACASATLEVQLRSLFSKKIESDTLEIHGLVARTVVRKDGESSLSQLFKEPEVDSGSTASWFPKAAGGEFLVSEKTPVGDGLERFNVEDLPVDGLVANAKIIDGRFECRFEKTGALLVLERVNAALEGLDILKDDLANHNRAGIDIRCALGVEIGEERILEAELSTEGVVEPFEVTTGYLNPSVVYEFTIAEGSYVEPLAISKKLAESIEDIDGLEVDIDGLVRRNVLQKDVVVPLAFVAGKTQLARDVPLEFEDYTIVLEESSWVDPAASRHDFNGKFRASPELTEKILEDAERFATKKAGDAAAAIARSLVEPMLEDGRVAIEFYSKGDLDNPKVGVKNLLENLVEELGKQLFKKGGVGDLLKGLFGR